MKVGEEGELQQRGGISREGEDYMRHTILGRFYGEWDVGKRMPD